MPIPKNIKNNSEEKYEKKDLLIKKFKVQLDLEKPEEGEEYEPFGRIGKKDRYPKRLHIPPLRFWNNERRNYDRGMLSTITLIDDQ